MADQDEDVIDDEIESGNGSGAGKRKQEDTAEYWRNKYNGLNGVFKKEQNKVIKLTGERDALLEEKEGIIAERDLLTQQVGTHQTNATTAAAKAAKLESELNLGRLIRQEYPALTNLYDKGRLLGLDTLEGDALKTHLAGLAEDLGAAGQQHFRQGAAGSTPAPTGNGETAVETEESLYEVLMNTPVDHKDRPAIMERYTNLVKARKNRS